DWHNGTAGDADAWLPLAGVRARQAGRLGSLSASELAVWKLRLARDAGVLSLDRESRVREAVTPVDQVYAGFLELHDLRRLLDGGQPMPFSCRFGAAWCSVSPRTAHQAIRDLRHRRLIQPARLDPRGTPLWLP